MFKRGVGNIHPSFGFCSSYKPSKKQQRLASCCHRNSRGPNKLFSDGEILKDGMLEARSILYPDNKGQIENGPLLYNKLSTSLFVLLSL